MTYWPDPPSSGNQKRFEDDLKGSVSEVSFMIPSWAERSQSSMSREISLVFTVLIDFGWGIYPRPFGVKDSEEVCYVPRVRT